MRYSVYKALNEISMSLVEATGYLKEHSDAINMLIDCAEVVSAIKSTLESNKEPMIEEIHKFLNKVNEIADCIESKLEYADNLKELYDFAVSINKYCKSGVKYKFKVVFFAELGAKWDSMDSVYRAYKNRADCEVLVVIAPIFRAIKLPNGEIKSDIIYKDYLTDMGIEHIPFKNYDIKKDLPDLVFTSQPYESVTTEQFWAENIAPYTRLVYLPYYTSIGIMGDEQKIVQCLMPIYKLAWKIVCQSDKAKKVYAKYSPDIENKLIPCGLPKWDYVINMDNKPTPLPKGWEKLNGKKIILRNFHYNLSKPDSIIKAFYQILDMVEGTNIAFLIRLHPLTELIFNIYYTNFKEQWENAKKAIDSSQNVVIDRNETYEAAFKYSDIFLTGNTSLIQQYLLTKKPVVVMYWGYLEKLQKENQHEDVFMDMSKLCSTKDMETGYELCKKVFEVGDSDYDDRIEFVNENLPNSDGKIGERLANQLINEMLEEDKLL